ncbi:MAG: Uma2 family endonuclease [Synechococcaceae cyanobacterium SM2_3_1]|nr:Uma2 family endonuclease [Synechococcaceae cyanobacterium SM2_3_1]
MILSSHDTKTQPFTIQIHPVVQMSEDQFFEFCLRNPDLRIERTAAGDLILMSPASPESGRRNAQLIRLLGNWAEADGTGIVFDSSAGFTLTNQAMRAPDASWIRKERWQVLAEAEKQQFSPICPDFVVELRSPTDSLKTLQEKMQEYIDNGARLGWLIDPKDRKIYIYRPSQDIEMQDNPDRLNGDPVLPRFVLDLQKIW